MTSRRRSKFTPGRPAVPYLCANCGAECRHLIWEAMLLDRAEGVCPACKKWSEFVVEIAAQVNQVLSERSAGGSFIGVQNDAANQHRRLH